MRKRSELGRLTSNREKGSLMSTTETNINNNLGQNSSAQVAVRRVTVFVTTIYSAPSPPNQTAPRLDVLLGLFVLQTTVHLVQFRMAINGRESVATITEVTTAVVSYQSYNSYY